MRTSRHARGRRRTRCPARCPGRCHPRSRLRPLPHPPGRGRAAARCRWSAGRTGRVARRRSSPARAGSPTAARVGRRVARRARPGLAVGQGERLDQALSPQLSGAPTARLRRVAIIDRIDLAAKRMREFAIGGRGHAPDRQRGRQQQAVQEQRAAQGSEIGQRRPAGEDSETEHDRNLSGNRSRAHELLEILRPSHERTRPLPRSVCRDTLKISLRDACPRKIIHDPVVCRRRNTV